MYDYSKFPQRVKLFRIENNKTQQEVSDFLEISKRAYQKIESGNSYPSFETLIKVVEYYNVSLDYFVGRTDD